MKSLALREFIQDSFIPPRHTGETPDTARSAGRPRIAFIDLAKGICILLVVLYHLDGQIFGIPNFSALRMPLYFALSGLFFKPGGDITAFTVKKTNNILIPFLFWVLLGYALQFLYHAIEQHEIYPPGKLVEGFTTRIIPPNYTLW
ncbi:MAG: acyltransferase family protein, partial [Coprobacter sp.]|nr:acyltransferase family protein [Coprobacter sp.]